MSHKVQKAVIAVGGLGIRFLPLTKSLPKEMLPLGKKPVVLHLVEELAAAGIHDITFVVSPEKHLVETFFSHDERSEQYFLNMGKHTAVEELRRINSLANFSFVYTPKLIGNGHVIRAVQPIIGHEPFVMLWGDELILTHGKSHTQHCLDVFEQYGKPILTLMEIQDKKKLNLYGIAEVCPELPAENIREVTRVVEKPVPDTMTSSYAALGGYILTPEIFDVAQESSTYPEKELFLTDLLNALQRRTGLIGCIIPDSLYLDCGVPDHYLTSQIEYALFYEQSRQALLPQLQALVSKYTAS